MREEIRELIEEWNGFRDKISEDHYYGFYADEREKYCSLMAKTFPVLRENLQKDRVNKDVCFLIAALRAFGINDFVDGKGNCVKGDLYVDVSSFHECFMKALENDFTYDEKGFLIVPNLFHNAEADETTEYHVDTASFNGIEVKEIVFVQDLSRLETMAFGPYEWRVLEKTDDSLSLLSVDSAYSQSIESDPSKGRDDSCLDRSLSKWLNTSFFNEFSEDEREQIVQIHMVYRKQKMALISMQIKPVLHSDCFK